ncbi:hypothetical protein BH24ACT26_BH24ACT26_03700 [soil metagenome]
MVVGKRYRINLRSPDCGGYLEGLLRSTRLPRGVLGNDDGKHSIWVAGELFDWFLRTDDIDAVEQIEDAPKEHSLAALFHRPVCAAARHPSRALGRYHPRAEDDDALRAHAVPPRALHARRKRA